MQHSCRPFYKSNKLLILSVFTSIIVFSVGCEGEKTERSNVLPCGLDENGIRKIHDANSKCIQSDASKKKSEEQKEKEKQDALSADVITDTNTTTTLDCSGTEVKFAPGGSAAACEDKDNAEALCHSEFKVLQDSGGDTYSCFAAKEENCSDIKGAVWEQGSCIAKQDSKPKNTETTTTNTPTGTDTDTAQTQTNNDPSEESKLKLSLAFDYGNADQAGFAAILLGQDIEKITDVKIEVQEGQTMTDKETNKHKIGVFAKITFKDVKGNSCSNGKEVFYLLEDHWGLGKEISTVCNK